LRRIINYSKRHDLNPTTTVLEAQMLHMSKGWASC